MTALAATRQGRRRRGRLQTVTDRATGQPTNRTLAWRYRRGAFRPETVESADHYGELQAVAFDPSSSTVVAAGATGVGRAHSAAAVWTKVGARNWQKVCLGDCTAPAGRAEIWGVLALPSGGFVAVGQGSATSPTDFQPTVWTSDNGLSWQSKVLSVGEPGAVLWVARTAEGPLVAVGKTGLDQQTTAAVWTSDNGSAWRAVQAPALAGAERLHGVAALGNTLLAVGFKKAKTATPDCGRRRQTALFRSTDGGRTWQARRSSALANAEQWFDVVPYRGEFVALGYEFAGCSRDSVAAAWTSPTGIRWTKQHGSFGVAGSVFGRGAVIGPVFYAAGDGPSSSGATDDAERDTIWAGRHHRQKQR